MDICHPDKQGHKEGCEDPWLFLENKMGPRAEGLGKNELGDEVSLGSSNAIKHLQF
jgi:hypothetical protein